MALLNQYGNKCLSILKSKPVQFLLLFGLVILVKTTFAESALVDADPIVKDTFNQSIKPYLYIGEGVAAIVTVMFTRNIKTLGAVGGVAVFLNIVAMLAGI